MAKISFVFALTFFLASCFGPVKELKYQIEDSLDDTTSFIENPNPISEDFTNSFPINVLWNGSFSDKTSRNLKIAYAGQQIFYASADGQIKALNIESHDINWSYNHNKTITSGLEVSNQKIYFVDYDGYLISLSIDGSLEWKTFVGEVFSAPMAVDNFVVIKTTSNKFISFEILDGSINWSYQVPLSPLPTRSWGELSFEDGVIYSGISGGKIVAINSSNGLLIWESTFSPPKGVSEIERSNDTTSKVIVDDMAVYAVSSNGNLSAVSKLDGSILWKRPLSSFYGMASYSDYLFVTHNSGSIYCINKNDMSIVWRNADFLGRDVSTGFIYSGNIIVSDYQGFLHYIDMTSGKSVGRIQISDAMLLNPVLLQNNSLFYVSINGEFYFIKTIQEENISELKSFVKSEKILTESQNTDKNFDKSEDNNESLFDTLIFWD